MDARLHDILSTGKNMRHRKKREFDFFLVVSGHGLPVNFLTKSIIIKLTPVSSRMDWKQRCADLHKPRGSTSGVRAWHEALNSW